MQFAEEDLRKEMEGYMRDILLKGLRTHSVTLQMLSQESKSHRRTLIQMKVDADVLLYSVQ